MKKLMFIISCLASSIVPSIHGMNIFEAVRKGDNDLVEAYLISGLNPNQSERVRDLDTGFGTVEIGGASPLHVAAACGYNDIVKTLLHYNANVDDADHIGQTPAMTAAYYGHRQCLETLIAAGADLTIVSPTGFNALCAAHHPIDMGQPEAAVGENLVKRALQVPEIQKRQSLAILEAGKPRLGAHTGSLQQIFHKDSIPVSLIIQFVRQAAMEDALYGHNQ